MASIPSESEIGKLPRRARIALAARCARRVQPLFGNWFSATEKQQATVDATIDVVEKFGAGEINSIPDEAIENAVLVAQNASVFGTYNALSVVFAAVNAALSTKAFLAGRDSDLNEKIHRSLLYADQASDGLATQAIEDDYNQVFSDAQVEAWKDDTPVSPETFGPLWPSGMPNWWPTTKIQ